MAKKPAKKKTKHQGGETVHREPQSRPKLLKKPRITVEKLYQRISAADWRTATSVNLVSVVKVAPPKNMPLYHVIKATTETDENGHRHIVRLFTEDEKLTKKSIIITDCTCLTGDTLVLTDKGYKTIYSLAHPKERTKLVNYRVGDKIYPGTSPFVTGRKNVWEITLANRRKLKITPDHLVLVKHGMKNEKELNQRLSIGLPLTSSKWKRVDELKVGDSIVMHDAGESMVNTFVGKSEIYYRFYLVGFFYGDGSFYRTGFPCMSFSTRATSISKLLMQSKCIDRIEKAGEVYANDRNGYRQQLFMHSAKFNVHARELLESCDISRENRHGLTEGFLNQLRQSPEKLHGFVAGLIDSDGSVGSRIGIWGTQELVKLQMLLSEVGYASARATKKRDKGTLYSLLEKSGEVRMGLSNKELYQLTLSTQDSNLFFSKAELVKRRTKGGNYTLIKTMRGAKVLKIRKLKGQPYVYDITVPDANSFVAEGVIVHNCSQHVFMYEYANAKKGLSFIYRSNGDPPNEKNPGQRIGACKHVARLIRYAISKKKI